MALPIKKTPVLTGRDAVRFIKRMHGSESKPAPRKEFNQAKKLYDMVNRKRKSGI